MARCATIERNTKETKIRLTLELYWERPSRRRLEIRRALSVTAP